MRSTWYRAWKYLSFPHAFSGNPGGTRTGPPTEALGGDGSRVLSRPDAKAIFDVIKNHWPEYLIEGACLGLFMISAFTFGTLLEHPASPVHRALPQPLLRRFLMGLAMGSTTIAIIYSPWGKRSGAHINPATTLTFYRLGKIDKWDAMFYVASQFLGGSVGAISAAVALSAWASHPAVNYVVTMPGAAGAFAALIAEMIIAFILMTVVLQVSSTPRLHKLTGLCAGILVAVYITVEAPISGMSMNPARTFASAVPARYWAYLWIYFLGPVIGMASPRRLTSEPEPRQTCSVRSFTIKTRSAAFFAANRPVYNEQISPIGVLRL